MKNLAIGILLITLTEWHCYAGAILSIDGGGMTDLKNFPANQSRQTSFTLTNTGDATLKIKNISSGCECMNIILDKHDAEPGKKINMQINLRPGTITGHFQKTIMIKSNATPPVTSIVIFGNAIPLVEILPGNLIYDRDIPPNQNWTATRQIKTDSPGVKLGQPKLTGNYPATVELKQKNPRQWQLRISAIGKTVGQELQGRVAVSILEPAGWPPLKIDYACSFGLNLGVTPMRLFIPADPKVAFVRSFTLGLSHSQTTMDSKKLKIPVMDRTTFRVLNDSSKSNGITIEMRREANPEATTYYYPTITFGYIGASNTEIQLIQVTFLNK